MINEDKVGIAIFAPTTKKGKHKMFWQLKLKEFIKLFRKHSKEFSDEALEKIYGYYQLQDDQEVVTVQSICENFMVFKDFEAMTNEYEYQALRFANEEPYMLLQELSGGQWLVNVGYFSEYRKAWLQTLSI